MAKYHVPPKASGLLRLLAFILDMALLAACIKASLQYFDVSVITGTKDLNRQILFIGLYFYFFFTVIPHRVFSQTFGEMIFGMKLVSEQYKRLELVTCIKRDCIWFPLAIISFWTVFTDKQGLHDKICETFMVESR